VAGSKDRTALLRAGQAAFDRGAWFEAHERWEEAWHLSGAGAGAGAGAGGDKTVIQGLIQLAAALVHLDRGRIGPAARLARKAHAKLSGATGDLQGVDLARARAALERLATATRGSETPPG
jgi:uncharacterized protein